MRWLWPDLRLPLWNGRESGLVWRCKWGRDWPDHGWSYEWAGDPAIHVPTAPAWARLPGQYGNWRLMKPISIHYGATGATGNAIT